MSSPWLWFVSRACGIVSLGLLTIVVVLGVVTAGTRSEGPTTALAVGLHRMLGLWTTVFVLTHIVLAVLDTYVPLGWLSMVVPFGSPYHRIWVGFGTIAFDLYFLVLATSVWRLRLSLRSWRAVHWLSYVLAPAAVIHGLLMADDDQPAFFVVTVVCGGAMAVALVWRLVIGDPDRRRRTEIDSGTWT